MSPLGESASVTSGNTDQRSLHRLAPPSPDLALGYKVGRLLVVLYKTENPLRMPVAGRDNVLEPLHRVVENQVEPGDDACLVANFRQLRRGISHADQRAGAWKGPALDVKQRPGVNVHRKIISVLHPVTKSKVATDNRRQYPRASL